MSLEMIDFENIQAYIYTINILVNEGTNIIVSTGFAITSHPK